MRQLWILHLEVTRVYYFFGAKQHSIKFGEVNFSQSLNFVLIPIAKTAKNNLDFHLCYYLGKLDETLDKDIIFDVVARDEGYCGIIDFINNNTRVCNKIYIENDMVICNGSSVVTDKNFAKSQVKHNQEKASEVQNTPSTTNNNTGIKSSIDAYKKEDIENTKFVWELINQLEQRLRPKKLESLKNRISNFPKAKNFDIDAIIHILVTIEAIAIDKSNQKITYFMKKHW